jgi:zinc/manganese transport system substrate-binding protein
MYSKIFTIILFIVSLNSHAKTIVTSLPEFAWAVEQLTEDTKAISLLEGSEDPHFVDASPSFIFKVARADMIIFNGLELEVGWLPKVLEMSGNEKVQPGHIGYCDASKNVTKIESLKSFDRSMGDIHPNGNPHYTVSIPRMIESISSIKDCLEKNGFSKEKLQLKFDIISKKLTLKHQQLKSKIKANKFYVYHREFNYLAADYSLSFKQSLEKVPGVLPSATFLAKVAIESKADKPKCVLAGSTSPRKTLEKFKEMSGVDYKLIPLHPKKNESYLSFIDKLTKNLL